MSSSAATAASPTAHPLSSFSSSSDSSPTAPAEPTVDSTSTTFSRHLNSAPLADAPPTHHRPSMSTTQQELPPAPKSSYYFGPPGKERAFGTPPCGVIGRDRPREIVRIERDYTTGQLPQFHPAFPLELEGRITPTAYSELVNDLNVLLISAHSPRRIWLDNTLAILTFYLSPFVLATHYQRKLAELEQYIDQINKTHLNPQGLNLLSPRKSAYLFIELEYY